MFSLPLLKVDQRFGCFPDTSNGFFHLQGMNYQKGGKTKTSGNRKTDVAYRKCALSHCWWFRNPVNSRVEVGSSSIPLFTGFQHQVVQDFLHQLVISRKLHLFQGEIISITPPKFNSSPLKTWRERKTIRLPIGKRNFSGANMSNFGKKIHFIKPFILGCPWNLVTT